MTNATSMSPNLDFAVFPLFSRINHGCTPNVYVRTSGLVSITCMEANPSFTQASYNPSLGTHTAYATRDIKAQEELLTSYIDPLQPMRGRAADLLDFNIDCECATCMPGQVFKTSEKHRHSIQQVRSGLLIYDGEKLQGAKPPDVVPREPNLALNMAEVAIELMHKEQLVDMSLAKLHRQAAKYALQLGRVEKAKAHATKEAEAEKACLGSETLYLNDFNTAYGGGNAAAWMSEIERMVEKDRVKIRMCEKRIAKETKKAEKKAEKKAGKKSRR